MRRLFLRSLLRGKKKRDPPTAIELLGGKTTLLSWINFTSFWLKKQIEASHLLPQKDLFQGEMENLYSLI